MHDLLLMNDFGNYQGGHTIEQKETSNQNAIRCHLVFVIVKSGGDLVL